MRDELQLIAIRWTSGMYHRHKKIARNWPWGLANPNFPKAGQLAGGGWETHGHDMLASPQAGWDSSTDAQAG
jgi:hypothetical protein